MATQHTQGKWKVSIKPVGDSTSYVLLTIDDRGDDFADDRVLEATLKKDDAHLIAAAQKQNAALEAIAALCYVSSDWTEKNWKERVTQIWNIAHPAIALAKGDWIQFVKIQPPVAP